jgi:hypothetical protein
MFSYGTHSRVDLARLLRAGLWQRIVSPYRKSLPL